MDRSRLGRCYQLAGRGIFDRHGQVWLVHGVISRDGGTVHHAWVEFLNYAPLTEEHWVWESVTEEVLPWEVFERMFGATRHRSYSRYQAFELMRKTKHYGPWNDGARSTAR